MAASPFCVASHSSWPIESVCDLELVTLIQSLARGASLEEQGTTRLAECSQLVERSPLSIKGRRRERASLLLIDRECVRVFVFYLVVLLFLLEAEGFPPLCQRPGHAFEKRWKDSIC